VVRLLIYWEKNRKFKVFYGTVRFDVEIVNCKHFSIKTVRLWLRHHIFKGTNRNERPQTQLVKVTISGPLTVTIYGSSPSTTVHGPWVTVSDPNYKIYYALKITCFFKIINGKPKGKQMGEGACTCLKKNTRKADIFIICLKTFSTVFQGMCPTIRIFIYDPNPET
jgi:hypothetical protein